MADLALHISSACCKNASVIRNIKQIRKTDEKGDFN